MIVGSLIIPVTAGEEDCQIGFRTPDGHDRRQAYVSWSILAAMTSTSPEALQARFGLRGLAHVTTGNVGLACVRITAPAATGEIYLHGAHITAWRPAGGEDVIFVSRNTHWADGEAIRGGVPICTPWFRSKEGDPKAPKHGPVRIKSWNLDAVEAIGDAVRVTLSTTNDPVGKQWWPHDFTMRLRATFGAALHIELDYVNEASEPVTIAEALHSYLAVGDVRQATLAGLDGVRYRDNLDDNREKRNQGVFHFTKETDNAFLDTATELVLTDPVLKRRIRVSKLNSQSTVVWNPSAEGAQRIPDLGDDEWPHFVCVEPSNVMDCELSVAPGETHMIGADYVVEEL